MPILGGISLLAQIFFAVHAIKTGRDRYWLFIIILFPGIGCLIYFFSEYLPDLKQSHKMRQFKSGVEDVVNPGKKMRKLEEQLELTPSTNNKKALAKEYVNAGMFDQAISLYESCLQGMSKDDPYIMEGLSCAYFFKGDYTTAKRTLEKLKQLREDEKNDEFDLLYARTLEVLGEIDAAREVYAKTVKNFSGEEARCRYASFLKQQGELEEAIQLYEQIIKNARLSPKYYRKEQKRWLDIAKKEIR
jgi:hypothetical protein